MIKSRLNLLNITSEIWRWSLRKDTLVSKWNLRYSLLEKWPYSELHWSAFSRIRTEYREILRIFPYSVRMREYADQNNSEYGHLSRSDLIVSTIINKVLWVKFKIE